MIDIVSLRSASGRPTLLGEPPALSTWLSRSLRARYDGVLREPLPEFLRDLVSGMDRTDPIRHD